MEWRERCPSVGVPPTEHLAWRAQQYLEIETNARVLHVPVVVIDSAAHRINRWRCATKAVHLRPAGYARPHAATERIVGDERAKLLVVCYGMRSRTDK